MRKSDLKYTVLETLYELHWKKESPLLKMIQSKALKYLRTMGYDDINDQSLSLAEKGRLVANKVLNQYKDKLSLSEIHKLVAYAESNIGYFIKKHNGDFAKAVINMESEITRKVNDIVSGKKHIV